MLPHIPTALVVKLSVLARVLTGSSVSSEYSTVQLQGTQPGTGTVRLVRDLLHVTYVGENKNIITEKKCLSIEVVERA